MSVDSSRPRRLLRRRLRHDAVEHDGIPTSLQRRLEVSRRPRTRRRPRAERLPVLRILNLQRRRLSPPGIARPVGMEEDGIIRRGRRPARYSGAPDERRRPRKRLVAHGLRQSRHPGRAHRHRRRRRHVGIGNVRPRGGGRVHREHRHLPFTPVHQQNLRAVRRWVIVREVVARDRAPVVVQVVFVVQVVQVVLDGVVAAIRGRSRRLASRGDARAFGTVGGLELVQFRDCGGGSSLRALVFHPERLEFSLRPRVRALFLRQLS